MAQTEKQVLRMNEAAAILGINRTTLWKAIKRGDLRAVQVGGRRKVHVDDIAEYLGRRPDRAAA